MKKAIFLTMSLLLVISIGGTAWGEGKIVYDAEYQKVLNQHVAKWASEDKELAKRLADLEAKHGKKPNIIYFMWDDAAYGRVGHPMLSKLTGIDTPNIDKMAQEGMTLTRMYTDPPVHRLVLQH
jgi:arylsulfatase